MNERSKPTKVTPPSAPKEAKVLSANLGRVEPASEPQQQNALAASVQANPAADAAAPSADASAIPAGGLQGGIAGPGLRRPERIPFGTPELKMTLPPREGFVRRWFKDTPGRVQRAMRAGYSHVFDDKNQPISTVSGKDARGGAEMSYAMEIPKEFYDEDFAKKQQAVDKIDHAIHRGRVTATENVSDRASEYIPDGGIKIESRRTG